MGTYAVNIITKILCHLHFARTFCIGLSCKPEYFPQWTVANVMVQLLLSANIQPVKFSSLIYTYRWELGDFHQGIGSISLHF